MAWSSGCLTVIVGALGQQMGQDTSGTARLCCLMSEAASWEDVSGGVTQNGAGDGGP